MSTEAVIKFPVTLDQFAQDKVAALLAREGRDDLRLRIGVQSGGCSGMRYEFFMSDFSLEGDLVHDFGPFEAVVDKLSAPYLEGSLLSFSDTIESQGFSIDNPNASGTCACGDSFH